MPGFFSISSASISELGIVSTGVDGNASGSLVNITVVTLAGSSIGSAEASSSLVTVSTSSQDGSASGSASGQAFPTIPISFIVQGNSSALGDGLLGNFTPGDYQQNFSSAFGTANASAEFVQAFQTIPISFIVQGNSSALGDGLLGNFTPGDYQQNFSSAFGTANASAEFVSVTIIHLDGSAEARNPPSWARSRIFSIVSATPSARLSTTNNAARNVVPIN